MTSILSRPGDAVGEVAGAAAAGGARDLHLDELSAALAAAADGAAISPVMFALLPDADAVAFRHEVFRDLASPSLRTGVAAFSGAMATVQERLDHAGRIRHRHERNRWRLDAASAYVEGVGALDAALAGSELPSRALTSFRRELRAYVGSSAFSRLDAETQDLRGRLDAIRYRLRVGEHRITVARDRDEPDYGAVIRATFSRFRVPGTPHTPVDVFSTPDMNPVEAAILDRLVRLAPDAFRSLDAWAAAHGEPIATLAETFARESRWYLAWLDLLAPLEAAGLEVSLPALDDGGEVDVCGAFDLALALRLTAEGKSVATSDLRIAAAERSVVVTGPSRGGKTTLARALAQVHHLAAIGCPVPAASARVPLVDAVFAHFDQPEEITDPGGRLEADLRSIAGILEVATRQSLVVFNESFSSTTVGDALELSRGVIGRFCERGARSVVVTYLDELAGDDGRTASLAATRDPVDPARRTFRFERGPADGSAQALADADRHRLGRDAVRRRVAR